ncbi:MAG: hypothetical protein JWQ83_2106, partial [Lacunisphaera sp.]|nr:hypothetical protein [Lacunisphaera sp.]
TPNFNVELAALRTDTHTTVWDPQLAAGQVLKADTNLTLPSGAPNPNAGKPYFESIPQVNYQDQRSDSLRAVLSYKKDLGWLGTHTLAGVYEYDFSKTHGQILREEIISPNAPDLTNPAGNNNRIWRRTYVDFSGPSGNIVMAPFNDQPLGTTTETLSGKSYTTAFIPFNTNTQLNSNDGTTMIGMLQSAFWKNRIKTIVGVSRDERNDYTSTQVIAPLAGFTGVNGGIITPLRSHTPNTVVAHSVSFSGVYQVTDWLGLTFSKAANSSLPSFAGRLNSVTADPASFSRPPIPHGKSEDVGFKLDILDHRLFLTAEYFQTSATKDFDFTTIAATVNPIWAALVQAAVVPSTYTLADVSTGQTFDSYTQGYEMELTANLTEHWRVFLNYSDEKTTRTNIGTEQLAYIAAWRPLWVANSGLPLTTGTGTVATQVAALDALAFTNYTLADGKQPLGQSQHKLNLVTNYDFSAGALKGFSVGGGIRYNSAPVIGFTATGTAAAPVRTVYRGSEQYFVDVNAAYRRKITFMHKPVMWSLQANINNVLNNDAFVRLRQASDGQLLNYKFNAPLEWIVTTKFSF